MSEPLRQLIYISTATCQMSEEDLTAILNKFRPRNGDNGITGMLLFCEGHFMQVLEGPPDVIETLYTRICSDPRHTRHQVMFDHAIAAREFGEWQMAFHSVRVNELREQVGYLPWTEARGPNLEQDARHFIQYFHDMMSIRS
ncbi:MAG: BLUF domain-containing protein [Acidobacteriota bacterium]